MEIKKHHHTVPVALIIAALLALVVTALSHLTVGQYASVRSLSEGSLNVRLTNGLTQQPLVLQAEPNWSQAGSDASLQLSL